MKSNDQIMQNNEQIKVIVCMGSACFVRGNNKNLDYIENLINKNNLNIKLELSGTRCENKCSIGPNIIIDNKVYNNVTKAKLEEIFSTYILEKNKVN